MSKNEEILSVVRSIKTTVVEDATLRQEFEAVSQEKDALVARLAQVEAERDALSTQVKLHTEQVRSLATEAISNRHSTLTHLFRPVSFIPQSHLAPIMLFPDFKEVLAHLPNIYAGERIQFISRPPSTLPMYIPVLGQHGYWFNGAQGPFQLVVEGLPAEWTYLGKYVSAPFVANDMRLSEWLALDERTRVAHASQVAALLRQPTDQTDLNANANQQDIKRRYDTGEWKVPCFSLQCVGYSMPLCQALQIAALKVQRQQADRGNTAAGNASSSAPAVAPRSETAQVPQTGAEEPSRDAPCCKAESTEERVPKKMRLSPKIMVKLEL